MVLLTIYDSLPHWMGITNTAELVIAVVCVVLISVFYFLLGYGLCACNYRNPYIRCAIILLWPVYLAFQFVIIPFKLLYYLTIDKEFLWRRKQLSVKKPLLFMRQQH